MAGFGVLNKAKSSISTFKERGKDAQIGRLASDTDKANAELTRLLTDMGIKAREDSLDMYFKALGIRPTKDKRVIRGAYLKQIKLYHPDISSKRDAAEKSMAINEAYHVLTGKDVKIELFIGDNNKIDENTKIRLENMLVETYTKERDRDYKKLIGTVGTVPVDYNFLIDEVNGFTRWKGRFDRAVSLSFGGFFSLERTIDGLGARAEKLARNESKYERLSALNETTERISELKGNYKTVRRVIDGIVNDVKSRVESMENKAKEELMRSVRRR
ncbi:MAG: DnaJ domain-containing protein [Candidatus Marsarchaeota archaeon]|nr:DnaJ domain-containing protein [Candidatus Marsarchaeota archaeon]